MLSIVSEKMRLFQENFKRIWKAFLWFTHSNSSEFGGGAPDVREPNATACRKRHFTSYPILILYKQPSDVEVATGTFLHVLSRT